MAPQAYQLVMRTGPTPGKVFELTKDELSLGRDITNEIIITDAEVSRRHARLIAQAGGYVLEDTGSTNGTFVNGQRLMGPHLLRPGELILLGENVSLAYESTDFDPDATLAAASFPQPSSTPVTPRDVSLPPRPVEQPVQPVQPLIPSPPPIYSGQVAPGPVEAYPYDEEEAPSRTRTFLLAGCGCLLIVACLAVVGLLFWIDAGGTERWCQYLGFLFSACP